MLSASYPASSVSSILLSVHHFLKGVFFNPNLLFPEDRNFFSPGNRKSWRCLSELDFYLYKENFIFQIANQSIKSIDSNSGKKYTKENYTLEIVQQQKQPKLPKTRLQGNHRCIGERRRRKKMERREDKITEIKIRRQNNGKQEKLKSISKIEINNNKKKWMLIVREKGLTLVWWQKGGGDDVDGVYDQKKSHQPPEVNLND